ncbi:IS3 family transposase [Microbispora triticiradicis]|uniref:IS3 family transposase n=1 Tax=Microbispora triticiradicis TaxID=2200763 RepID=UPI003A8C8DA5
MPLVVSHPFEHSRPALTSVSRNTRQPATMAGSGVSATDGSSERQTPATTASNGVRKVWRRLLREGHQVARCTVERRMRALGLHGATIIRMPAVNTPVSASPPTW